MMHLRVCFWGKGGRESWKVLSSSLHFLSLLSLLLSSFLSSIFFPSVCFSLFSSLFPSHVFISFWFEFRKCPVVLYFVHLNLTRVDNIDLSVWKSAAQTKLNSSEIRCFSSTSDTNKEISRDSFPKISWSFFYQSQTLELQEILVLLAPKPN